MFGVLCMLGVFGVFGRHRVRVWRVVSGECLARVRVGRVVSEPVSLMHVPCSWVSCSCLLLPSRVVLRFPCWRVRVVQRASLK